MTTSAPAAAPPKTGRHQRSIRNYLLDARFQLKYTGFIVGAALVVAAFLGVFLWRTSREVMSQSEQVVQSSKRVADESRKVSDVVKMTIKDDPVYGQNPELMATFSSASDDSQKEVERQQQEVESHHQALVKQQRNMGLALFGGLTLMVVLMGLMGIYTTHKIAGPIYKMKLLLRQVATGKLNFKATLRKGDELQDFFVAFQDMVDQLKSRQAREVERLEAALAEAQAQGVSEAALAKARALHEDMKRTLEV
jgi:nitrogen fixation/metabolism regulation signal transduction histidine kinase